MNAAEAFGQYLALIQANLPQLSNEPALLQDLRSDAMAVLPAIIEQYRPDKSLPEECRADVMFAPDYGINLRHLEMTADVAASFHCGVPNLNCYLIVVVGDVVHFTDSMLRLPDGLEVYSLRNVPEKYKADVHAIAEKGNVLNTLLLTDGIYIRVAEGCRVEKPVQIVNLFNSEMPMLTPRRVIVDARADSSVRLLLCDHSQSPATPHLNSQVIDVKVAEGARVEVYDIEESAPATRRKWEINAAQSHNSELVVNTTYLHGGVTANDYNIELLGNGCYTNLSGLAICTDSQIVSNNVTLRHHGEHCTSKQLFKTAVFDQAHGAFGGRVIVDQEARYTDAAQTNRNILVSPEARMDASPQLEIYCDEVKASHGATTGQLDERALFYMQSRGIPREEARRMLTQAFMSDVIDNVGYEVLRQRLHVLVEKRLNGDAASCSSWASACHNNTSEL